MKKILYFSLTAMLILAVTLSGCGRSGGGNSDEHGDNPGSDPTTRYFTYVAKVSYISAYSINATTGALKEISSSPFAYTINSRPSAIITIRK